MLKFKTFFCVPPFTFFEMKVKVYFHAVELVQSALCKTPEVLNPVDVNSISKWEFTFAMVDSKVLVDSYIYETIVSLPAIWIQDRIFYTDFSLYYRSECYSFAIRNNLCIYFYSSILIFSLDESKYWLFESSSSSFKFSCKSSFSLGSEIAFIYFYFSTYLFFESLNTIRVDYFPKDREIMVDRLSIISQKLACFCGINIHTKALNNLFKFVNWYFAVWDHKKRVYELLSSGLEPILLLKIHHYNFTFNTLAYLDLSSHSKSSNSLLYPQKASRLSP